MMHTGSVKSSNKNIQQAHVGEQRWRSGESTHLPPLCFGFDSWTRHHMWVEFVVGSLFVQKGFSQGIIGAPKHGHITKKHDLIWYKK